MRKLGGIYEYSTHDLSLPTTILFSHFDLSVLSILYTIYDIDSLSLSLVIPHLYIYTHRYPDYLRKSGRVLGRDLLRVR